MNTEISKHINDVPVVPVVTRLDIPLETSPYIPLLIPLMVDIHSNIVTLISIYMKYINKRVTIPVTVAVTKRSAVTPCQGA